jgi:hypothetical protein
MAGPGVGAFDGAQAVIGGATDPGACDQACNTIVGNSCDAVLVCDSVAATCGSSSGVPPSSHVAIEGNSLNDNIEAPPSPYFAVGRFGEISLYGQDTYGEDPANCTAANTAGASNDYLPCPAPPASPTVEYDPTTGLANVLTCAGCTVDFYTWKTTSSTAGGSARAAEESHGGSQYWEGQATPTAGTSPCDPSTSGSCTDNTLETATLPKGLKGITATATITYMSGGQSVTDTSEFGANTGSPTLARVASFTVTRLHQHGGHELLFRWRMVDQEGVAGYDLFVKIGGRSHGLINRLIPVHAGGRYSFIAKASQIGRFNLRILLTDGRQRAVWARLTARPRH